MSNFHLFFYWKIETEIESGLFQQAISTLNKLLITLFMLRPFEQKLFYCQKNYATFNFLAIFLILAIIRVRKKLEISGFHHSS